MMDPGGTFSDDGEIPGQECIDFPCSVGKEHLHPISVTRRAENESEGCPCHGEDIQYDFNRLDQRKVETDARLRETERRLALSEQKLRSCNEMLVLIGRFKSRIDLLHGPDGPLRGDDDANLSSSNLESGLTPTSPIRSPIRSPISPVKSPKSPKSPRSH